ncbi:MAG: diguanylate cyclase [Gammaproteobacteria bacterium]
MSGKTGNKSINTRSRRWFTTLTAVCLWHVVATATAVAPVNTLVLTPAEQEWLAGHPVIRLAPDPDFPPIEFIDADGRYQGIAADYAALVERKLGIKFTLVQLQDWDEVLEKARSREIDMFGAASESPQRAKYMTFTRPHIQLPGVIIVRNDVTGRLRLEDLQQQRVAVVSGYIWEDLLHNDFPDLQLRRVPDLKTGLKETSFGMVDAMVANLATASWYIQREGITNLRVAGESGYFGRYAFATRKDWPELNGILEKALDAVTPEEHRQILQRWVSVDTVSPLLSRTSTLVIASFLALLLAILVWNRALKSQVQQRTTDLEKQLEQRRKAEQALDQVNNELESRVMDRTARLEQSNQRLRAVLDNVLESIITIDRKGIVQSVNPSTEQIFGYAPEEIIGQNVKMLMAEPHRSAHDQYLENYHSTRTARIIGTGREVEGRHKDGTVFPLELSVTEIAAGGQSGYVGVLRDITERKQNEVALVKARTALQLANEKLFEQTRTDALTGIFNRRYFDEALDMEMRRTSRTPASSLSLIFCDIDYFKLYNDSYGHIAGDKCLQQVAAVIKSIFKRASDAAVRYGGEEFAVIMPATNAEHARVVAEKLRQAIWDRAIAHASSRTADRLTLSIGVATLPSGETITVQKFTSMADEALYTAKANGRNRVEEYCAEPHRHQVSVSAECPGC